MDYSPQNVELRPDVPVNSPPGGVSPPRIDTSFEDIYPLFSPLGEDSDDEMGIVEVEPISNQSPEGNWQDPPDEYFEDISSLSWFTG